jgi:hypothetical protein
MLRTVGTRLHGNGARHPACAKHSLPEPTYMTIGTLSEKTMGGPFKMPPRSSLSFMLIQLRSMTSLTLCITLHSAFGRTPDTSHPQCSRSHASPPQLATSLGRNVVVVVVTVGSRPKRVEPSGQLAEHCVDTLRGDGECVQGFLDASPKFAPTVRSDALQLMKRRAARRPVTSTSQPTS